MNKMLRTLKKAWGERLVTYAPEGNVVLIWPCGTEALPEAHSRYLSKKALENSIMRSSIIP